MTLKRKLLVTTAIEFLLVIAFSAFLVSSSQQIALANQNEQRATKILEAITQTRFVAFENMLHHDERSFSQWQSKHKGLLQMLSPEDKEGTRVRQELDKINKLVGEEEMLFSRLYQSYSAPATASQQQLQDRLATQVMLRQQGQISLALNLAEDERNDRVVLREQERWLLGGVIALMLIITVVNFFFITRTITRALTRLQLGAQKIASGQFDYRIPSSETDDEFGRVTNAFNAMASDVGLIDKVKSEFILLASHQLRTPLTAVKWYSKTLVSPHMPLSEDKVLHYLNTIHDSNERMITLVNNLLSASKVDMGNLAPKPEQVQVARVLEQVLVDLTAQIEEKNISIGKNINRQLPMLRIDPAWVHIILQNLLSNAIKYSDKGQHVTVSLWHKSNSIRIAVTDEGIGIPSNQHDKVFTKLFRADNAQLGGDGSGLGLYITKAMVEQAGGKIWFESVEHQGTVFYVSLPVKPQLPANKKAKK